jgi:hypothetical protein
MALRSLWRDVGTETLSVGLTEVVFEKLTRTLRIWIYSSPVGLPGRLAAALAASFQTPLALCFRRSDTAPN